MEVKRIIIAKKDEKRDCLAGDGEILIAASSEIRAKFRVRKNDHFFVGITSGNPSLYGMIDQAPEGTSIEGIVNDIDIYLSGDKIAKDAQKVKEQVEFTISAANRIPIGSAVVSDFREKSFMDKSLIQTIHKVFF